MEGSVARVGRSFFSSKYRKVLTLLALLVAIIVPLRLFGLPAPDQPTLQFVASIDTMKESRDTETRPLTPGEISAIVRVAAGLQTNYITVDTHWDYPNYMQEWIAAVRASGKHVWFRIHPNRWEDDNGTTGIMTPAQYEAAEHSFILAHPSFFQPGDILDPCPEPEQGRYWNATFGQEWTSHAPNDATRAYNAFLRDTTDVADAALHQEGIYGVVTTARSINSFFASHPDVLEYATVEQFGYITVDSYPEKSTRDPAVATNARISELNAIEQIWHVPIIIGEMGYSNDVPVDDTTQQRVLGGELHALAALPYLAGINYWVGPGSNNAGGYTYLFVESNGTWRLRSAASELSALYKTKEGKT